MRQKANKPLKHIAKIERKVKEGWKSFEKTQEDMCKGGRTAKVDARKKKERWTSIIQLLSVTITVPPSHRHSYTVVLEIEYIQLTPHGLKE